MSKLSQVDPRLLDFVTWSVLRGVRMFQRVRVTSKGLIATERIPLYDFAVIVPTCACVSVLNIAEEITFPMRVSSENFGNELSWWPDLCWGSFAFIGLLTQYWIMGNIKGIQSYLNILPFDPAMPIGRLAIAGQKTPEYRKAVHQLVEMCHATNENFDIAFRHMYCLFRRHGIPLWSSISGGHPYFSATDLAKQQRGEIIGMVPIIDLAPHSSTPNSAVGFPDQEMMQWLAQERGLRSEATKQYIVLQTTRNIEAGEIISADRNQFFGFDKEPFNAWFGFPYDIPVIKTSELLEGIKDC